MANVTVDEKVLAEFKALKEKQTREQARTRSYGERSRAKIAILTEKAAKAGIKVTDAEIEKYLADNK